MDQFKAKFREEAGDLLAALEKALLKLEQDFSDTKVIEEVFRVMHTLKGNSAMFELHFTENLTHHLETIFDNIREGKQQLSPEILDISLASIDHLRYLLDDETLEAPKGRAKHEELLTRVVALSLDSSAPVSANDAAVDQRGGLAKTFFITFKPKPDLLKNGSNPLYIIEDLHALGQCKAIPYAKNIPGLPAIDPAVCYISWGILLSTVSGVSEIHDVFLFVEDDAIIEIDLLGEGDFFAKSAFDVAVEKMKAAAEPLGLKQVKQLFEVQQKKEEKENAKAKEQQISSIRVSSDKLDKLMNLVSEMVTTQARLSLFVDQNHNAELLSISEEVENITRRLRDNTFSICLIPIEHLFVRFERLVRDLSRELKKDIQFVMEGGETELDKSIIESLTDPILHILRNCIDHGIEPEAKRIATDKPAKGKILLSAYYTGAYVNIKIEDDGAGIDPEKIKAKAIAKRLIPEDAALGKAEIFDLLFVPGFSTASKVTEISGRGVGMDVVKRKIAELRGDIFVDSEIGKGTAMTIQLPLTLSVIDGFLVKVANTHYVIPIGVIDRCYEIKRSELENSLHETVTLDGQRIPFIDLKNRLGHAETPGDAGNKALEYEHVITVYYNDKKIGLVVDTIIGEYQAVLKPLGKMYKDQDTMSGATILGDGTIALVMDTAKTANKFLSENNLKTV